MTDPPPHPKMPRKPFAGRNSDGTPKSLPPEDAAAYRKATNEYRKAMKRYQEWVAESNKASR